MYLLNFQEISCYGFQSILAGDYVMGMASLSLSKIGNPQVVSIVSQIIEDLVRGRSWFIVDALHAGSTPKVGGHSGVRLVMEGLGLESCLHRDLSIPI